LKQQQEVIPPDQEVMLDNAGSTQKSIAKFYAIVITAFAWVFTYGLVVLFAVLTHPIRDALKALTKG
jgi:hypothetical protein